MLLENGGKEILLKSSKELGWICSCPSILWKVELGSDEIRYLAEEIFKQNIEEAVWFLLVAHSKVQQERNYLKIELLIRMKAELKRFQNSQPTHIEKNEKACVRENTKGMAIWPFNKEINLPSGQKPGAIVQDNRRIIPKTIQSSSELPSHQRSRVPGAIGVCCTSVQTTQWPLTSGAPVSWTPLPPSLTNPAVALVGPDAAQAVLSRAVWMWLFPLRFQRTKPLGRATGSGLNPRKLQAQSKNCYRAT